jgi:hypothetical protein
MRTRLMGDYETPCGSRYPAPHSLADKVEGREPIKGTLAMLNLDKEGLRARKRHTESLAKHLNRLCIDAAPHIKEALEPFTEFWGKADVECFIYQKPRAILRTSFRYKICRGDQAAFEATISLNANDCVIVEAYAKAGSGFIKRSFVDREATGRSVAEAYLNALKSRIEASFEAVVLDEEDRLPFILID